MKIKKKLTKEELNKLIKNHNALITKDLENRKLPKKAPENVCISLQHLNKVYPNHVQAVYNFSLDVKPKEFIVFVGPSGCGKSTTLRMIAGLEDITCGDLYISGEYANDLLPSERDAAMVFQSYALYPNLTVFENMAFSLRVRHLKKDEINEKVYKAAKILEIEDYLDRKPGQLSGGQRQRVALGRAIVRNANVFLMDEPLSNLDAKLRVSMRSELVKLHNQIGATTIYVTHDQTEAMTMADRIVVMNDGYIQQIGTPKEVFNHPSNLFVATFVGAPKMNILDVKLAKDCLIFENGFQLKINQNIDSLVNEFYSKELDKVTNDLSILEKDLENRKFILTKKDMLRRYESYFKKKQSLVENIQITKKNIVFLNEQDIVDQNAIENCEKQIKQFEECLSNLEKDYAERVSEAKPIDALKEIRALERDEEYKILLNDKEKLICFQNELEKIISKEAKNFKFGVRPEDIIASKNEIDDSFTLQADFVELLGNFLNIHFNVNRKTIIASLPAKSDVVKDESLFVSFDKERIHLFDPLTEKAII